jgi:hypothetical protein
VSPLTSSPPKKSIKKQTSSSFIVVSSNKNGSPDVPKAKSKSSLNRGNSLPDIIQMGDGNGRFPMVSVFFFFFVFLQCRIIFFMYTCFICISASCRGNLVAARNKKVMRNLRCAVGVEVLSTLIDVIGISGINISMFECVFIFLPF